GEAVAAHEGEPREQLTALARSWLDFALTNRGMFELMFRHDLLESGHLGLRETSLPLFAALVDLVAEARPDSGAEPRIVAGALWANLHGIAQLWGWGSLQLAVGADDPEPLLRAALDAHLGPEVR
ncbi:WHG domain-containing protein, partial [Streptomyces albiflaviniger]|nr:WHG domain-containing protein [Streptomyces albiflaviniger]